MHLDQITAAQARELGRLSLAIADGDLGCPLVRNENGQEAGRVGRASATRPLGQVPGFLAAVWWLEELGLAKRSPASQCAFDVDDGFAADGHRGRPQHLGTPELGIQLERGMVTLKNNDELIRTGLYPMDPAPHLHRHSFRHDRDGHDCGQLRGVIRIAVVLAAFYLKARREERFLREEFGAQFDEHAKVTGMFLPRLT